MKDYTKLHLHYNFETYSDEYADMVDKTSDYLLEHHGHDGIYLFSHYPTEFEMAMALPGMPYSYRREGLHAESVVTSFISAKAFSDMMINKVESYMNADHGEYLLFGLDTGPGWERWIVGTQQDNEIMSDVFIWMKEATDAVAMRLML
jgi:predicted small metal-binding protein